MMKILLIYGFGLTLVLSCAGPKLRTINTDLSNSYSNPLAYFHAAAGLGDIIAAMRCVEENLVDINKKDQYGWTACMYAARNGREGILEYCIAKGADINARDDEGN